MEIRLSPQEKFPHGKKTRQFQPYKKFPLDEPPVTTPHLR
jgi:ribosomal protein S8E